MSNNPPVGNATNKTNAEEAAGDAGLRPWRLGRGLYVGGDASKSFVGVVSGDKNRLKNLNQHVQIPESASQALEWVADGLPPIQKSELE